MLVNIPSLSELVLSHQKYKSADIKEYIKNFIDDFSKNEKDYVIRLSKNNLMQGENMEISVNKSSNNITDDIILNIVNIEWNIVPQWKYKDNQWQT